MPTSTIRRLIILAVSAALVVGACSGDDGEIVVDETTTTSSSTTTAESTTTTAEPDPTAPAAEVWAEAWTTSGQVSTTDEYLASIAEPAAANRLVATLHFGEGEEGVTFEGRTVTNHPIVEDNADGTFAVNDCLLISPPVTSAEANWYSGTIETVDGALKVTSVQPQVVTGCVPASIAEEVYAVWDRYWELQAEGVRPGNTEFEAMISGGYEEFILPLLSQDGAAGKVFRQFDEQYPEIIEFRSGFASVSSCTDAADGTGYYDTTTGERLPESVPEAGAGTRNLYEVQFTLLSGQWKVSSRGGQVDSNCSQAPTSIAIPEVG